jgi:hypothetical protein
VEYDREWPAGPNGADSAVTYDILRCSIRLFPSSLLRLGHTAADDEQYGPIDSDTPLAALRCPIPNSALQSLSNAQPGGCERIRGLAGRGSLTLAVSTSGYSAA